MGANFRFNAKARPTSYQQGVEDGRDGHPLDYHRNEQYRAGWYHGYHDQLARELRAYNARHGTDYKPRGAY